MKSSLRCNYCGKELTSDQLMSHRMECSERKKVSQRVADYHPHLFLYAIEKDFVLWVNHPCGVQDDGDITGPNRIELLEYKNNGHGGSVWKVKDTLGDVWEMFEWELTRFYTDDRNGCVASL